MCSFPVKAIAQTLMSFYAVQRGRCPGVYNSWQDCSQQVTKFPGAVFKKFKTYDEADRFANSRSGYSRLAKDGAHPAGKPQPQRRTAVEPSPSSSDAATSFAIVYTDGSCFANGRHGARGGIGVFWGNDDARNLSEPLLGRQTNQRAEIRACCRGWRLSNGDDVKHRADFEHLHDLRRNLNVRFVHVAGHAGVYGNERADQLACAASASAKGDRLS